MKFCFIKCLCPIGLYSLRPSEASDKQVYLNTPVSAFPSSPLLVALGAAPEGPPGQPAASPVPLALSAPPQPSQSFLHWGLLRAPARTTAQLQGHPFHVECPLSTAPGSTAREWHPLELCDMVVLAPAGAHRDMWPGRQGLPDPRFSASSGF